MQTYDFLPESIPRAKGQSKVSASLARTASISAFPAWSGKDVNTKGMGYSGVVPIMKLVRT